MRWMLIDRFETIEKGVFARGIRAVNRSEGALVNFYPCYPVMPSSLLIEMMAQVGGVLTGATINFTREVILAKVDGAEFPHAVIPPALLEIEARLKDSSQDAAVTECRILSAGRNVAKAEIFFVLFEKLGRDRESVVFSRDFMETFAIRNLITEPRSA